MSVYLDYNASTPIDERVLDVMIDVYRNHFGNADSRTHEHGIAARNLAETARGQMASMLGVEKHEIVFTSGATESNNISILGLAEYGEKQQKKHIISTAIEHKSILEPLSHLQKLGFEVDFVSPDEGGVISSKTVLSLIRKDTLLVSIMHANNETGMIQPVDEIGKALHDTNVLFHIDAAQSCGKLADEIRGLKYDLLSVSGHKMYAPQGVGALIMRNKSFKKPPISPIMFGGGHEGGVRAGTLPVALIAGLGEACAIAEKEYMENLRQYMENKNQIIEILQKSGVNYAINGNQDLCMANTLNVSFLGVDSEALLLSVKQYCSMSNGSACTSRDYSHSHVLSAMGLTADRIESAIRISWGPDKIQTDNVEHVLSCVQKLA